jgi:hypothetical protein
MVAKDVILKKHDLVAKSDHVNQVLGEVKEVDEVGLIDKELSVVRCGTLLKMHV